MPTNWTGNTAIDLSTASTTNTWYLNLTNAVPAFPGTWTVVGGNYARVPACACGHRSDKHWEHTEEECTWLSPVSV